MPSDAAGALNEALDAFSRGAVDTTREVLDAALHSAAAQQHVEDAFALCCFRGSIAAMEGARNVAELLAPCAASEHHDMLLGYLEGLSLLAVSKFEQAQRRFEGLLKAFSCGPGSSNNTGVARCYLANLGLAATFFHQKRYKETFTEFRTVLESLGSEATPRVVRVGMAMCAFCLGNAVYAKKMLEREVGLHPDNDLALLALLVVYVHLRLMPSVVETVVKLRERLPESPTVLIRAADLLYFRAIELKNIRSAAPALLSILEKVRASGTAEDVALADYQEGRLHIVLGNFARAEQLLEASSRLLPQLLPARIHYAHLLVLSGRESEGLRLLLELNDRYPNQKEVLQLLACHVSERGAHEAALLHCRRLIDSVAPGDVCSWALAAFCSRLDKAQCHKYHQKLIMIHKELKIPPSLDVLANEAVLSGDVAALQALVDNTLGASYLPQVSEASGSHVPEIELRHVPLLYNLALLTEKSNRPLSRHLYTLLVKTHCTFQDAYFRLFAMSKEDGHHRQAVMWLSLLSRVLRETRSHNTDLPRAFIGVALFEDRQFKPAMALLRAKDAAGSGAPSIDPAAVLCLAVFYLRCAHMRGKDNKNFLRKAKAQFERVLRHDPSNLLAAHGLGCCLGIEDEHDRCQSLLNHVSESLPNRQYVKNDLVANISNVKTRVENFKQAIDYLPDKSEARNASQDTCLGLCYAAESRFTEAREVLLQAMKKWPDRPMIVYNAALVHCTAFLHGVATSGPTTMAAGLKLRDLLQEGVVLALQFLSLSADSREMVAAQGYLKHLCHYCMSLIPRRLQPLIAVGTENARQEEQDAQRWADTLAQYKAYVEGEKAKVAALKQREAAEEEQARKSIRDRYMQGGAALAFAEPYNPPLQPEMRTTSLMQVLSFFQAEAEGASHRSSPSEEVDIRVQPLLSWFQPQSISLQSEWKCCLDSTLLMNGTSTIFLPFRASDKKRRPRHGLKVQAAVSNTHPYCKTCLASLSLCFTCCFCCLICDVRLSLCMALWLQLYSHRLSISTSDRCAPSPFSFPARIVSLSLQC
eukprot:gene2342-1472_t